MDLIGYKDYEDFIGNTWLANTSIIHLIQTTLEHYLPKKYKHNKEWIKKRKQ